MISLTNLTRSEVNDALVNRPENDPKKQLSQTSWPAASIKRERNEKGINFFLNTSRNKLAYGGGKNFLTTPITVFIDDINVARVLFTDKNRKIYVHYPVKNNDETYNIVSKEIRNFEGLKNLVSLEGLRKPDEYNNDYAEDLRESLNKYLLEKRSQLRSKTGVDGQTTEPSDERPRGRLYPPGSRIRRLGQGGPNVKS